MPHLLLLLLPVLISFAVPSAEQPQSSGPTLYLSRTAGANWVDFTEGLPSHAQPRGVAEAPDGTLYLTTIGAGVWAMLPGDCVWQPRSSGLPLDDPYFFPVGMTVHGQRLILSNMIDGIWLSDDEGLNWRRCQGKSPATAGAFYADDGLLLAGSHSGVWQSTDNGESWFQRAQFRDRINAITGYRGTIVVARQNGLGILAGDRIVWSPTTSDTALLQLFPEDDFVYAVNFLGEIFRSADGQHWEKSARIATAAGPYPTLGEALWRGYRAGPDGDAPAGTITPTRRGWVVGLRSGC